MALSPVAFICLNSTMYAACGTSTGGPNDGTDASTPDTGRPPPGNDAAIGDDGGDAAGDAGDADSGSPWANAKVTYVTGSAPCGATKDDNTIYWAEQSGAPNYEYVIKYMPFAGGSIATIATPPFKLSGCGAMAVDAQKIYIVGWVAAHTAIVMAIPKRGGAAMNVATPPSNPDGMDPMSIAVDATNIYYAITNQGVYRVPVGGGTIDALVASTTVTSEFAADGTMVYFSAEPGAAQGTIYGMPKSSPPRGPLNTLVNKDPTGLALDDAFFFFGGGPGSINVGRATTLYRAPKAGGAHVPIGTTTGDTWISKVAIHGNDLFYTAHDMNSRTDRLVHMPKAGGPQTVVTERHNGLDEGILTDGATIYVFSSSGLLRITR